MENSARGRALRARTRERVAKPRGAPAFESPLACLSRVYFLRYPPNGELTRRLNGKARDYIYPGVYQRPSGCRIFAGIKSVFDGLKYIFFFREMISSSFLGETGAVRFNPNGERSSFKFSIVKVMRKPEGGLYWNIVGHVDSEASHDNAYGPSMFEPFLPRDLPRPRHLRIVSIGIHDTSHT